MTASAAVHLAPTGLDTNDGCPTRPVATLARAVALTRQEAAEAPRRILVQSGEYFDTGVELTAADSGLTIEAASEDPPVFYGGRRVTGWREEGRLWIADLPTVAQRQWDFRSLLVNGRYAARARFPETGAIRHDSEFPVRWMSTTKGGWERPPTAEELTTLRFRPESLPETLDPANAELTIYHSWDESLVGVASIDRTAGVVRFSTPAGHPPGAFGGWKEQARTFVVWNTREGLTQPGQWYLDRSAGCLVYRPLAGEELATAQVIAPTRTTIVRLAGTVEAPVREIMLRGLAFAVTTTPMKAGGFGAGAFDGALQAEHTDGVRVEQCQFHGTGGWGAKLLNSHGAQVRGCTIRHTGAGGLAVSGSQGQIADCLFHSVGLTYPSAMALNCHGSEWVVEHNEFHHTPYSAVTAGGEALRIERNLFHHVMQELVDGAAIYVYAGKRCMVRGNCTHSVRDEQVHAYYLDEQSADSTVEGNLAVNVPWPLHMHMASRCTIRGSVCVHTGVLSMSLPNCDGFVIEGNILAAGGELRLSGSYTGVAQFRRNVFWSGAGAVRWDLHDRLPSLERNADPVPLLPRHEQTIIADPRIDCSVDGLARLLPGSPAAAIGLCDLDVRQAGRRP